jgi:uncharacterized protein
LSTISTSESAGSEKPNVEDFAKIGRDLKLSAKIVERAIRLLDEGNTIPFITRFRKDLTEGLDEKHLLEIKRAIAVYRALDERKAFILKSLESQGVLTDELRARIAEAATLRTLEDVYLPFKPQKQSRALVAKQQGLEALMEEILSATSGDIDLAERATHFVRVDKGLNSVDDVIRGVGDLLIDRFSANAELRNSIRQIVRKTGMLVSKGVEEVAAEASTASSAQSRTSPDATSKAKASESGQIAALEATPFEAPATVAPAIESQSVESLVPPGDGSDAPVPRNESGVESGYDLSSEAVVHSVTSASEGNSMTGGEVTAEPLTAASELPANASPKVESKRSRKKKKKKAAPSPFKDYVNFKQPFKKLSHHQFLAISRGERAGKLKVRVQADEEQIEQAVSAALVPAEHPFAEFLKRSAQESLTKAILPSIEREIRRELTDAAEKQATDVFANNLRNLLLQPPLRSGKVLAIDPGFKSGCGAVVLDDLGNVLEFGQVYVVGNQTKRDESKTRIVDWARRHNIRVIAIGSGAACRQAEQMISDLIADSLADLQVRYVMVNEAGASVYSISEIGREELPELSPAIRSAVSIGRRLQDPLSEFAKISPPNIGVGMYQHDVKAKHLVDSLDEIVQSCVNQVGVNVNTASISLLRYVSGLNSLAARRLVEHRQKIGGFKNRQQLKEVNGIGEATFVQAAGFLRIFDGENPLDRTSIHPESYPLAEAIMKLAQASLDELFPSKRHAGVDSALSAPSLSQVASQTQTVTASEDVNPDMSANGQSGLRPQEAPVAEEANLDSESIGLLETRKQAVQRLSQLDIDSVAQQLGAGKMLVRDIILALKKPAWDPRDRIAKPIFRSGILKIDDLKPEMQLEGQVVNVVDFGVFVDIGLGESSLVHVSQLSNRFVADPHRLYAIGDILRVWVGEVDSARRRVKLTAVNPTAKASDSRPKPKFKRGEKPMPANAERPADAIAPPNRREGRFSGPAKSGKFDSRSMPHSKVGQAKPFSPRDSKARFESKDRGEHKEHGRPLSRRVHSNQPAPPITEGMLKGDEPMRSFSDLLQFVKRKPIPENDKP